MSQFSKFGRFYRRFSNHVSSSHRGYITGLISTTSVFSAATIINTQNEQRIESSTKNLSSNSEQETYHQMLNVLDQTSAKLNDFFNKSKGVKSDTVNADTVMDIENINHAHPLKLDPSLNSEWLDFYDKIDLIFTNDEEMDELNDNMRARMERLVRATQEHFCHEIQELEMQNADDINGKTASFKTDLWKRPQSRCGSASLYAGGLSKVLVNGNVFEKAGVSVSISSGKLPKRAVQQMTADHNELQNLLKSNELGDDDGNVEYYAASVSSVCHPWNPNAPTGHFNYRYFELGDIDKNTNKFKSKVWWFGGGGDLSPSILDEIDCKHFHSTFKECCDKYDKNFYDKFKKWCDNYFVIKHRGNERRGIGGIFFDDLSTLIDQNKKEKLNKALEKETLHNFVMECASNWSKSYIPLVKRHTNQSYTENEKEWQQIRRGRYVEFNLVYDRGTKFGLMKPGARIESILMSMPLTARWDYCRDPIFDFEQEIYDVFKTPRDWV